LNAAGKMGEIVEFLKFDELEKKLRDLITDYAVLKKRNLELEGLLQNTVIELEEANRKIGGLKEERDAIRTKVDSLLDLLQEIKAP
jgi:uncharacterized coiled-coil DUF342 family protein